MLCTGGAAQVALAITCPTCWALLPISAWCMLVRCPAQSLEHPHPSHELPALPSLTSPVSRELPFLPQGRNRWGAATTLTPSPTCHKGTSPKGRITSGMTPRQRPSCPTLCFGAQIFGAVLRSSRGGAGPRRLPSGVSALQRHRVNGNHYHLPDHTHAHTLRVQLTPLSH